MVGIISDDVPLTKLFALRMQVKVKLSPFQNDDDDVAREAILI